ncbi:hypothetical protein F2P81_026315 [Scophthalmus maximus]|uniref:Uncharacterized protein n=1 Tax=Scophthalmus maximus TaxID=52904 RepID=A0A6A4RQX9_SCOMX|nr:hypothetical protein F2P81_026315 [Scophthalmus maximus]
MQKILKHVSPRLCNCGPDERAPVRNGDARSLSPAALRKKMNPRINHPEDHCTLQPNRQRCRGGDTRVMNRKAFAAPDSGAPSP